MEKRKFLQGQKRFSLLAVGDGVQWSRLVLEYKIKTKLRNFNNFFFLSDIFGGIFCHQNATN